MNKKVISALLCGAMVLGCAAPVMAADKAGGGQKIFSLKLRRSMRKEQQLKKL